MSTGEKIKRLRKNQHLSQLKLASILLVSRQTISNWENDKTIPELESLVLLCAYFNLSLDNFLAEDISKINIKHNEFHFAKYIFMIVFGCLILLFLSALFSIKYNRFWLVIPFVLVNIILLCVLLFWFRNKSEDSLLIPLNKKKILFIMFISGFISFFSMYFLLSLL